MNFLESICDCRAVTLVQPTSSCFGGLAVRGKTLEVEDLIIKELSPKQHAVHTLPKSTVGLLGSAREIVVSVSVVLLGSAK